VLLVLLALMESKAKQVLVLRAKPVLVSKAKLVLVRLAPKVPLVSKVKQE
jgi:hypothetical protein